MIGCNDAPAAGTPKTPPQPTVAFSDPPTSTKAGAPSLPDDPAEEASESPAYERSEHESQQV